VAEGIKKSMPRNPVMAGFIVGFDEDQKIFRTAREICKKINVVKAMFGPLSAREILNWKTIKKKTDCLEKYRG